MGLLVLSALASPASAQKGVDPTLDCEPFPTVAPHPRELGLPAALDAAVEKRLTLGGLGYVLDWAAREPDPIHIPVLKQIVEVHRCFIGNVELAMLAIEAAGEPSDYFVRYAQDWRRDDRVASAAFNALAARGDSTVRRELEEVAEMAPYGGTFGYSLSNALLYYNAGVDLNAMFDRWPVPKKLEYVAVREALWPGVAWVHRGVTGDSLSFLENETRTNFTRAIARKRLRSLAEAYPTAVQRVIVAYEDTLRSQLLERDLTPIQRGLFLDVAVPLATEAAFPSNSSPTPPAFDLRGSVPQITTIVCIEEPVETVRGYAPDDLVAVFSYVLEAEGPIRLAYGEANTLRGPWNPLGLLAPIPPEVFFPADRIDAPGRPFRVAFELGETVSWTLLGQTVTATAETPRCHEK